MRDISTIKLRPRLASQAPNVRRIIVRVAIGFPTELRVYGTNRTIVSMTPSSDSKDIRRWD